MSENPSGKHVNVKTQAELDAALAAGDCPHVTADAEESVQAWQAEQVKAIKVNGEW